MRTSVSTLRNEAYSHGATCDLCGCSINGDQTMYHCDACKYDLCVSCFYKIVKCKTCDDALGLRDKEYICRVYEQPSYFPIKCSVCSNTIEGDLMIECGHCKKVMCLSCYSNNVSVKPTNSERYVLSFLTFCFFVFFF